MDLLVEAAKYTDFTLLEWDLGDNSFQYHIQHLKQAREWNMRQRVRHYILVGELKDALEIFIERAHMLERSYGPAKPEMVSGYVKKDPTYLLHLAPDDLYRQAGRDAMNRLMDLWDLHREGTAAVY